MRVLPNWIIWSGLLHAWFRSGPIRPGPGPGVFSDLVLLALDLRSPAPTMPTSRPGSEPVEFWVDGSRRDGTVEDFYSLGSELGRYWFWFWVGLVRALEWAKVVHMRVHVIRILGLRPNPACGLLQTRSGTSRVGTESCSFQKLYLQFFTQIMENIWFYKIKKIRK